jgi:hypothetical protein
MNAIHKAIHKINNLRRVLFHFGLNFEITK